jgi:hypothetical protein
MLTIFFIKETITLIPRSNVEVVGRVTDDLAIKEFVTYNISDNFGKRLLV